MFRDFLKTRENDKLKEFKIFRNKVTSALRKAKSEYYSKLFSDVSKRSDLIWKNLNDLLNLKPRQALVDNVVINGATVTGKVLTNQFNDFFVNVATLNPQLGGKTFLRNCVGDSIFLYPTDANEVITNYLLFNNSKSCDINGLQVAPNISST